MQVRSLVAATFALLMAASAGQAQGVPGRGGFPGGGGWGGQGRGGVPRRYRPQVDIPDLGNPIRRYILENHAELKLSDAQAGQVDSVARLLDGQNDSLIAQVRRAFGEDSASVGERGGPRAAPEGDDVALRDRLNVLKPTFKQIRKNDDDAWKAATALLSKDQRKQADRLKKDAESAHDRARNRWRSGAGPGSEPGGMDPD